MTATNTKPRIFLRKNGNGEWCCIVLGDVQSRMGVGPSPLRAYYSWRLYNAPWMQPILKSAFKKLLG